MSPRAGIDNAALAKVSAELGAANTLQQVIDAAVTHITGAIGAAVATLMLVDNDELRMVGGRGLRPGIEDQWAVFGLSDDNPASEAAREMRPITIANAVEADKRYTAMRGQLPSGRSLLALPVPSSTGSTASAVLGLTFDDEWKPTAVDLDLLTTFASACGQALNRLASAQLAAQQTERLTFLANASAALSSSLDYPTTLQTLADLAVPALADWCTIDVAEDGTQKTLAIAHADPDKVSWAWQLQTRYPTDPDAPRGSPAVIRTGRSELHADIPDELLVAAARDSQHLQLVRELQMRSALVVPLVARGQTHGALSMIRTGSRGAFDATDLALAEDLGRRAGLALDNARLYASSREVARQLQRAVVPDAPADIAGWDLATYYAPGGAAEVGGDFYDALTLPEGRLALVIGDVMGHGLPAAADMAQLRSAVRAYLVEDAEPAAVLRRLTRLFELAPPAKMATIIIAVLDPAGRRLTWVNAGHYPPILIARDGSTRTLWSEARRPLSASVPALDHPVGAADTAPLTPQSVLLLFTDGLAERRGELLDHSLARLATQAATLVDDVLTLALPKLVERVDITATDDDVTAIAARAN